MITVVGSINMDLVVSTRVFPKQGETVLGDLYTTVPGGKGANQAVAAARLGSEVQMLGAVGNDAFGDELLAGLEAGNVQLQAVERKDGASGIANILLSEGDNRIIVVPGANHKVTVEEIEVHKHLLANSSVVIMQLELPIPVVQKALEICYEHEVPTILNPAPASGFNSELLKYCTYLTPNETEAEEIFGGNWQQALEQYPNRLVVTLGEKGAQFYDGEKHVVITGFPTKAVDTTGAGDTFNGALGAAIAENMPFAEAVRFANAAASLSVEKFGAQGGMPVRDAVMERMAGGSR
ncbi:ribokinase [Planococcus sp. N028]|uniref:Ribokinase n=1 Tax=Planococcus shixiaomingii TaxID=3058393 RepID=A0ABT8N265_9BACL|nr:ribokinase [Planococcus sp. N028]MDN7241976.1 ribokinase [Planococcus sp. N028]